MKDAKWKIPKTWYDRLAVCSAHSQPLGGWFMPLVMLLVFGPIVVCLVQLYRKK